MTVRWIGQSGYLVKTAATEIIIDPYLSDIVNKVANRPRLVDAPIDPKTITASAVVCTHDHLDHLDPDAIAEMPADTRFITTNEGVEKLKTLGRYNAVALSVGDAVTVGDITLTAVFAKHTVEAFGVIVEADGVRLYLSGDTLFDEKLFDIAAFAPDVTFICINGKLGNMNVEEALTVATRIGAKVNVPTHYGMFASNTADPADFSKHIAGGFTMAFDAVYRFDNGRFMVSEDA